MLWWSRWVRLQEIYNFSLNVRSTRLRTVGVHYYDNAHYTNGEIGLWEVEGFSQHPSGAAWTHIQSVPHLWALRSHAFFCFSQQLAVQVWRRGKYIAAMWQSDWELGSSLKGHRIRNLLENLFSLQTPLWVTRKSDQRTHKNSLAFIAALSPFGQICPQDIEISQRLSFSKLAFKESRQVPQHNHAGKHTTTPQVSSRQC